MSIKGTKKSKEPKVKKIEENLVIAEDLQEKLPSENMQEDIPEDNFKEDEKVENTLDIQESVILHNKNIEVDSVIENSSSNDHGGLKGNPGQQARFNHLMENKHEGISKYFHSGKK